MSEQVAGAPGYPFAAVVGMDEVKQSLLLGAVEPRLGGVLLRGEKGSAKTTLARGLAALLPGDPPPAFVELPIGATEDRVVGTIDLAAALRDAERRFHPGLLSAADGGVLYVDEVNLLPDHIVDLLLDVAASGVSRVERDGISIAHPSSFILVGSMNPEEGELRPQLLDRFGLSVDVRSSTDPSLRAEAVTRRLAYDASPARLVASFEAETESLRSQLASYSAGALPFEVVETAAALAVELGADGLRADLALCRAAAALAGLERRDTATVEDLRRVASFALGHRRRRGPFDEPGISADEIDAALKSVLSRSRPAGQTSGPPAPQCEPGSGTAPASSASQESISGPASPAPAGGSSDENGRPHAGSAGSAGTAARPSGPAPAAQVARDEGQPTGSDDDPPDRGSDDGLAQVLALSLPRATAGTRPAPGASGGDGFGRGRHPSSLKARGRVVSSRPATLSGSERISVVATALAAAERRGSAGTTGPLVERSDLHCVVSEERLAHLVVMCVDASGSMGARDRVAAARGAVLSLLTDAYRRRDRVALVTFGGEGARLALRPTGSVEVARARLEEVPTGGRTPLADGIIAALELFSSPSAAGFSPILVVVTDGHATAARHGEDPVTAARLAALRVRKAEVAALIVDVETGPSSLGLAADLAVTMGARHVRPAELSARDVTQAVRDLLDLS